MTHQHATLEDTVYVGFVSNDTSGSGVDGTTPLFDVRLAGAAASAAPVLSGTPDLLTHANYGPGAYEVAVAAKAGNGFSADATYLVFVTLTADGQTPGAFAGSFTLTPLATSAQVANLTNVGAAVNTAASSYTLTTGTQSSGTVASTNALDGTNHEHTDDTGAMDLYYEFTIGSGTPASATMTGYLNSANDDLEVHGYDWVAAGWVQIGTLSGKGASTNEVETFDLFTTMAGFGANIGLVRVRFTDGAFTLTSATLAVDQIFCSFSQGAGIYDDGAVWLDTTASNTNTVSGVDGVSTNPVSTIGAVNTLLANLNLNRVRIAPGSSVTFAAAQNNQVFVGDQWTLALGGQQIVGSKIIGATVSGIAAGTGTTQVYEHCILNACSHIKGTHILQSGIAGTQTVAEAGDFFLDRCHSGIAGTATWTWEFGDAIGNTNLNVRNYSGGIQLESMGDTGTDAASIEGRGNIIEGTCTGGTVAVRGLFTTSGITNLTLSDDARYDTTQVAQAILPPTNVALSNIEFVMEDTSGSPATGLTVTATKSVDGGAFGATTGTVAEVGNGVYQFDASAADMNGVIITFRFAAAAAADSFLTFKTA